MRNASAINHVAGPHPPFLILYGDKDAPRTGQDAEQMAKALEAAGNSADVHEIADHAHMDMITGIMSPSDPGLKFILEFVRKNQSSGLQPRRRSSAPEAGRYLRMATAVRAMP